jgi:FkbM family methyltransferase
MSANRVVSFIPLFWKHPELFLPHCRLDLPHRVLEQSEDVRRAMTVWDDEESRREFMFQLQRLVSSTPVEEDARYSHLHTPEGSPNDEVRVTNVRSSDLIRHSDFGIRISSRQYLPDDVFMVDRNEVVVDCGAYDGDTLRAFIEHARGDEPFRQAFAFEPDLANYRRLETFVAGLPLSLSRRIAIRQLAVGARKDKLRFTATGTISSMASETGDVEVDSDRLDDILAGEAPTYIKLDIEDMEPEALAGAQSTIRRHVPILAVCVYHRQDHLWRLPLLMQSFNPDYRLFLRRHGDEFGDAVCYAVPPGRVKA